MPVLVCVVGVSGLRGDEEVPNELNSSVSEPRILLPESSDKSPVRAVSARTIQTSDPLIRLVFDTREAQRRRLLSTSVHTPWQIMHGMLALRQDFLISHENKTITGLEWIASGPTFRGEHWFQRTQYGGQAHPYSVPYAFEGHINQFLAILSMGGLPLEQSFQTADGPITMRDMLLNAQKTVNEKEEITWTLWALSRYLPPDAQWRNAKGEFWSIEKLVKMQTDKPIQGAPCGGTHGLFALAHARNVYLRTGAPLRGVWLESEHKIRRYISTARTQQNADGSLSSNFFRGREYKPDFDKRMASAGHILEFLMIAMPQEELSEPWIRRAIEATCNDLMKNRHEYVSCSPLYHTVNALSIYLERVAPGTAPAEIAGETERTRTISSPKSVKTAAKDTPKAAAQPDQKSETVIIPAPKAADSPAESRSEKSPQDAPKAAGDASEQPATGTKDAAADAPEKPESSPADSSEQPAEKPAEPAAEPVAPEKPAEKPDGDAEVPSGSSDAGAVPAATEPVSTGDPADKSPQVQPAAPASSEQASEQPRVTAAAAAAVTAAGIQPEPLRIPDLEPETDSAAESGSQSAASDAVTLDARLPAVQNNTVQPPVVSELSPEAFAPAVPEVRPAMTLSVVDNPGGGDPQQEREAGRLKPVPVDDAMSAACPVPEEQNSHLVLSKTFVVRSPAVTTKITAATGNKVPVSRAASPRVLTFAAGGTGQTTVTPGSSGEVAVGTIRPQPSTPSDRPAQKSVPDARSDAPSAAGRQNAQSPGTRWKATPPERRNAISGRSGGGRR